MSKLLSILAVLWFILACLAWDIKGSLQINVRPEDAILLLMAGFVLQKKLFRGRIFHFSSLSLIVISFVIFLMFVSFASYFVNIFAGSDQATMGTFGLAAATEMLKEYIRLIKYVLVVFVFSNLDSDVFKASIITVAACCIIIIIIQLMQYAQVEGINDFICLLYGNADEYFVNRVSSTGVGAIDAGQFRSGSIFGNPNVLGGFLVAPAIILTMLSVRAFKTNASSFLKKAILLAVTCFIWLGIFMTQSRTAFVACLAAFAAGLIYVKRYFNLGMKDFLVGIGALVVLIAILLSVFSGQLTRYTTQYNQEEFAGGSMSQKATATLNGIADLEVWQLFMGKGPAQSDMVDNEIGYMLIWYGFLGLISYFAFFFILYKITINSIIDISIRSAFIGTLIAYLLISISASIFLNIKVFPIFIALLAVAVVSSNRRYAASEQRMCTRNA